jgi:hypothetical protein
VSRLFFAALLGLSTSSLVLAAACSKGKLSGEGGECFQAVDCEDGLICVPQGNVGDQCNPEVVNRVCSRDLSGVQTTTCGPNVGGGGDAASDAPRDQVVPDAPRDTGTDTKPDVTPPNDASDSGGDGGGD